MALAQISEVSRMQKANAIKTRLKKLFKKQDPVQVKDTFFFEALKNEGVVLQAQDVTTLRQRFIKQANVPFREVLARLAPDLSLDAALSGEQKWLFRSDIALDGLSISVTTKGGAGVAGVEYLSPRMLSQTKERSRVQSSVSKVEMAFNRPKRVMSADSEKQLTKRQIDQILQFPHKDKGKRIVRTERKALSPVELEQQQQFKFLYDHELNFDIITHQYFDWNSEEQYKTRGAYKPKYQEEYSSQKEAQGGLGKVARYLEAKHKHGPLFFSQLQEEAKDSKVIETIQGLLARGTDPRAVLALKRAFISEDSSALGYVRQSSFRKIMRRVLKLHSPQDDVIQQNLLDITCVDDRADFQKLLYFVDLFHFFPHIVKKDSNISPGLKDVLKSWQSSINKVAPAKQEIIYRQQPELLKFMIERASLRFTRRTSLFRFFDSNSNGLISPAEFRVGLSGLGIDFQSEEIERLFRYLDSDRDGYISYGQFCRNMEEGSESKRNSLFTPDFSDIPKRRELHSAQRMVGKVWRYKQKQKQMHSQLPSNFDNSFTYGVPSVHPDSIGDVICFNYQKEWIDKIKRLESEELKMAHSKAKNFHTRASKLRNEALLGKLKEQQRQTIEWESKLNYRPSPTSTLPRVNQKTVDEMFPSHGKPWMSKKSAFLRESVPSQEYQPQHRVVLRDDLTGIVQKRGDGPEYINELKRTHAKHKEHTSFLEQRHNTKAQPTKDEKLKQDSQLLDPKMLKDLHQGNLKAHRESRKDKANLLHQYFQNKKSLNAK